MYRALGYLVLITSSTWSAGNMSISFSGPLRCFLMGEPGGKPR